MPRMLITIGALVTFGLDTKEEMTPHKRFQITVRYRRTAPPEWATTGRFVIQKDDGISRDVECMVDGEVVGPANGRTAWFVFLYGPNPNAPVAAHTPRIFAVLSRNSLGRYFLHDSSAWNDANPL